MMVSTCMAISKQVVWFLTCDAAADIEPISVKVLACNDETCVLWCGQNIYKPPPRLMTKINLDAIKMWYFVNDITYEGQTAVQPSSLSFHFSSKVWSHSSATFEVREVPLTATWGRLLRCNVSTCRSFSAGGERQWQIGHDQRRPWGPRGEVDVRPRKTSPTKVPWLCPPTEEFASQH